MTYDKWTHLGVVGFQCFDFRNQMIRLFHDKDCFFFNLFHCIFLIRFFVYYSDHITKVTNSNSLFKIKISNIILIPFRRNNLLLDSRSCRLTRTLRSWIYLSTLMVKTLYKIKFILHAFKHWLSWWLLPIDLTKPFGTDQSLSWPFFLFPFSLARP